MGRECPGGAAIPFTIAISDTVAKFFAVAGPDFDRDGFLNELTERLLYRDFDPFDPHSGADSDLFDDPDPYAPVPFDRYAAPCGDDTCTICNRHPDAPAAGDGGVPVG